jgi:DNA polymerase II large subunit
MLLMDGLINFSREYLPDKRGGKMDAPLVLTTRLDPSEVDKEAHNIDVCDHYPLEFYEATLKYTNPKELESKMDLVSSRLGTPLQYDKFFHILYISLLPWDLRKLIIRPLEAWWKKWCQLALADKIRGLVAYRCCRKSYCFAFHLRTCSVLRLFPQSTRCIKCD